MTIQNNLQIKKLDQAFLNNCMTLIQNFKKIYIQSHKRLLTIHCKVHRHAYRHLCRVHEAQSEVVFLYDVQMVHNLVKQLLTFGFFLIRETNKENTGLEYPSDKVFQLQSGRKTQSCKLVVFKSLQMSFTISQFTIMYDKEKHQILTLKKMEPANTWHFCIYNDQTHFIFI